MTKSNSIYYRIYLYAKRFWPRILVAVGASLIVALTDVATAKLIQPLVDVIIVNKEYELVNYVPIAVVSIAFIKGLARYVQGYYIKTAGQLVVQDVRRDLFCHSTNLSMRFHNSGSSGNLMSIILNDVNEMQVAVSEVVVDLLRESFSLIGLIALVFYNDWKLASVAFIAIPLSLIPASFIGKKIKRNSTKSQEAMGRLTHVLQETLSGVRIVKTFGTESVEQKRFDDENRMFFKFIRKVLKYNCAASPLTELISSVGAAAVLWYGIHRVLAGSMSQGELFSFIAAMMMMYTPVKRLVRVNNKIQRSAGAAVRIFQFLDTKTEIVDTSDAIDLPRVSGDIIFDNVSFGYDDEELILKNFSLHVKAGEVVALVGPSGAGKSTIVNLLCRFYDPQKGQILLDDKDLCSVSQDSLRKNLAIVDQDTFLFNDSITDNILYGSDGESEISVQSAAQMAYADEFIEQLPLGYETIIGERGVLLSGGQKQRVCIARAILRDAPVLILDEATSALDTESETIVQKALQNLMQDRTTVIIAHRLSTIMSADRILVLEDGQIVESGSHNELLDHDGLYKKLYSMQFVNC